MDVPAVLLTYLLTYLLTHSLTYLLTLTRMDVPAVLAELPHSWHLFLLSTLIGARVSAHPNPDPNPNQVVAVSRALVSIAPRAPHHASRA